MADLTGKDERRRRLQRRAFGILGTFPAPARPGDSGPAPSSPTPPGTPVTWTTPSVSADDDALARLIETKAASLDEDFFAILDVPRTATKDQIKTGYLKSVKLFHPDRLPPSLVQLTSQMKTIFVAVRHANDTLQDDALRADYLLELCKPAKTVAPTASPDMDAEILGKQANVHLLRKEYAEAAEAYGAAFDLCKKPDYLAQQAWSIHLDPAHFGDLVKVKQMLNEAMRANQFCDKAAYALGVLARVEGDIAKAERYFKIAVAGNPRNIEAAIELRLIAQRRKKG